MLQAQLSIDFDAATAARDAGIKKALDTAERNEQGWGDQAFNFLKTYLQSIPSNECFMLEDIRKKSEGIVPEPISKRAWGAIVVRAKKAGLIKFQGVKPVTNIKAHKALANSWSKAA